MRRTGLAALACILVACSGEAPPPPEHAGPATGLPVTASAKAADPAPPAFRLPETVAPVKVAASLSFGPAEDAFSGTVDIDLEVKAPVRVIWLHAVDLVVSAASLDAGGKKRPARVVPGGAQMLGFAFDEEVAAGSAKLSIAYSGKASLKDDQGVFLEKEDGGSYVFTQFESTYARRALPCFDEPQLKVPWQLTLQIDAADTAVSNTPVVEEKPGPPGKKTVRFAETKPLPSYLVAFAVGPFDVVDAGHGGKAKVPLRFVVPRGKAPDAASIAGSMSHVIDLLEDEIGAPYPYAKLDVVVVPQLVTFGAMENAGMITARARRVLAKPGEDTPLQRSVAVNLMAHEAAHQWFGDLVTLRFWDDVWLNEGFAVWMDAKITNRFDPTWGADLDELDWIAETKGEDGLLSARKIRQEIGSDDDIQNAFDSISYAKGAATLGMFEAWMGPEPFRKGIHLYLDRFAHKNATSGDFLAALSEGSGKDVKAAFSTFLDQPGIPSVKAKLACDASRAKLSLSQERFLPVGSGGKTDAATWQIPVCVRYGAGKESGRACTLLSQKTGDLPLSPLAGSKAACPTWVMPNAGGTGYYYSAYSSEEVVKLLGKNGPSLTAAERFNLVVDLRAFAGNGRYPLGEALGLLPALFKDPSAYVQMAGAGIAAALRDDFVEPDLRDSSKRFVSKVITPRIRALGIQAKKEDPAPVRALRRTLLAVLMAVGDDPKLFAEATALATKWLDDPAAIEPESVGMVLRLAASRGDRKLFDRLVLVAKAEKDARRLDQILTALAGFGDPALVKASLSLLLDGTFEPRAALKLLFAQQTSSRGAVWDFLKDRWTLLLERVPATLRPDLFAIPGSFCAEAHRSEVETFLKDKAPTVTGAPRMLAQTLESISLCVAKRDANRESLRAFLKKQ